MNQSKWYSQPEITVGILSVDYQVVQFRLSVWVARAEVHGNFQKEGSSVRNMHRAECEATYPSFVLFSLHAKIISLTIWSEIIAGHFVLSF